MASVVVVFEIDHVTNIMIIPDRSGSTKAIKSDVAG
jgi:hypothetical protein